MNVIWLDSIDSTNSEALRRLADVPSGTVIAAREQTAGRGQRGNTWFTQPGQNLTFSIVLKFEGVFPVSRAVWLNYLSSLAVAEFLRSFGVACEIKWPNDVVINGRKLCGILTEMSAEVEHVHYIVIGVGINANLTSFPQKLSQIATSLKLELGRDVSRAGLIAAVMEEFERLYAEFERQGDLGSVMQEYNDLCLNAGNKVRVLDPNGEYTGVSHGINAMGELLVETEDGQIREDYAGEVSVRGIYGYV